MFTLKSYDNKVPLIWWKERLKKEEEWLFKHLLRLRNSRNANRENMMIKVNGSVMFCWFIHSIANAKPLRSAMFTAGSFPQPHDSDEIYLWLYDTVGTCANKFNLWIDIKFADNYSYIHFSQWYPYTISEHAQAHCTLWIYRLLCIAATHLTVFSFFPIALCTRLCVCVWHINFAINKMNLSAMV